MNVFRGSTPVAVGSLPIGPMHAPYPPPMYPQGIDPCGVRGNYSFDANRVRVRARISDHPGLARDRVEVGVRRSLRV